MSSGHRRDTYFGNLKFPADPVASVGFLKGKSNFREWHSAIQSVLLSNPYSSELILGTWTEPQSSSSNTAEEQTLFDEQRREWHTANTGTCRFIRETLATNVIPFVRQYNTAKTLFFNLVWLYGEEAGIDTQGGPPVPVNAHTVNARRGRASLLAVLESKRTLDYLPPAGMTFKLPSPTTPTSIQTVSSTSSSRDGTSTRDQLKSLQPNVPPSESISEGTASLIRDFERTHIADPNLETIHESEEPHPGRRIRISSGYAIGSGHHARDPRSQGSISPFTLSDSASEYDEDELHLEDIDIENSDDAARLQKRRASSDLEARPQKASIMSILNAVKPGKSNKRDNFQLSFPLRRLNVDQGKGKAKAVTV
ncbi:hypothetical protein H2200_007290 [Cladophialophora chaetospira]|uniref:Uncharacterized protein n=1 Tax=Cladophialophora chaetospira TaxID=386627 RepID=A0AA38X7I3_9EURO|nr:hypothetical protein H2200_007290 [Cladophialophora chaetospira]